MRIRPPSHGHRFSSPWPLALTLGLLLALAAPATASAYQAFGLNFSPYVDGQDPSRHSPISETQLRERMQLIRPYTNWVRSFGCGDGLEKTGAVAHELGLHAALGAWIGRNTEENDRQIECLIARVNAGDADLAIVGSETLLRGDTSPSTLIAYIDRVRAATSSSGVPVATADVYSHLLANPSVMNDSDIVMANVYPYWEGVALPHAVAMVHARYRQLQAAAPGKEIRVSETGWPSCGETRGEAVPSPQNAADYFLNVMSWAQALSVNVYYFEAHDESWKAAQEGPQGACWGITDKLGMLKPGMQRVFDGDTVPDNWSGEGQVGGPGDPLLEFGRVPAYGSSVDLRGRALHVTPADTYVAVYIRVAGGWWVKPTFAAPRTIIAPDGTWTTDVTTGGSDQQATDYHAFLLPNTFDPPLVGGSSSLPDSLAANAIASAAVSRTSTRPVSSFSYVPVNPTRGDAVTFTSQSADPNGTLAALQWDLDDDGEFDDAIGPNAEHVFEATGDHVVRLRVTDNTGEIDTNAQTVPVTLPPPDTTRPQPPALTGTDPPSPANDNDPEILGAAEPGSLVRLYTTADCSGRPASTGSAADLASPGLTLHVLSDAVTTVRATAEDAARNVSACSAPIAYHQVASRPVPLASDTSPLTPPPAVPAPPTPPPTAPIITRLAIAPRSFPAARRGPAILPPARQAGARVSFTLSRGARVQFVVQRLLIGRRVNGRCRAPASRNRTASRCDRAITTLGVLTRSGRRGSNAFRFTGRLANRALRTGRYRLIATPQADGRVGSARRVGFRIRQQHSATPPKRGD